MYYVFCIIYYILYIIYYVLCIMYYVLYIIYYVLCIIYYILYVICYIFYVICYTLYIIYYILYIIYYILYINIYIHYNDGDTHDIVNLSLVLINSNHQFGFFVSVKALPTALPFGGITKNIAENIQPNTPKLDRSFLSWMTCQVCFRCLDVQ